MLPKIDLYDLWQLHRGIEVTNNLLVNIRGCNGSGKSTIPIAMLESDPDAFEVTWVIGGKSRILATVFPKYNYLALGHYHSKCGGMDSMKTTDEIKKAVALTWYMNYNILMEGIMASTVRQTYIDLFTQMNEENLLKRQIVVFNILPPVLTCLERIQRRNGGKEIKEDLVLGKWKTVERNAEYFKNAGFTSLKVSNDKIPISETLPWYFSQIKRLESSILQPIVEGKKIPIIPREELMGYEWYPYYKEPDETVVFNEQYRDRFWWFISERLSIYYKRVILKEPFPWTDSVELTQGRFTNICRDMDRLTIYERKNILAKLDEPVVDRETREKSVMFNIMVFRVFVKIDSWECIGFIDFADKGWKKQWERGKKALLNRREQGISNFTGSFMVNDLHVLNPDPETSDNKTFNALCLCQYFIDHLEEIYKKAIKCSSMKEQLEFLKTIPGIGGFTAYELACSFAMANRYCKNTLVPWTQDNYTNVGPGAAKGLKWMFKDLGNLSALQAIIYLRSVWREEMKRLGYYETFMEQLPPELDGDIDLRVIEHCLCETQKLNKLSTGKGRPKLMFTEETTNVDSLRL